MSKSSKKNYSDNREADDHSEPPVSDLKFLINELRNKVADLTYISETDAPIEPVFFDLPEDIKLENFLAKKSGSTDEPVEIRNTETFFLRLTTEKDWFRERETIRAKRFIQLQKFLEQNLSKIRVYRVGKVKIDIWVLGEFKDREVCGIRTFAVET